jgi:hypothetical protein
MANNGTPRQWRKRNLRISLPQTLLRRPWHSCRHLLPKFRSKAAN